MRVGIIHYLFIIFATASCTSIETLKKTKIQADEFNLELFNQYRQFAEKEAEKYDWIDSQFFIDKAMLIAYGKKVMPETVSNWNIDKNLIPELEKNRNRLVEFINDQKLYKTNAKDLAQAQYAFDCLLEELEESWQIEDIAQCRNLFEEKMAILELASNPPKIPEAPKIEETQPDKSNVDKTEEKKLEEIKPEEKKLEEIKAEIQKIENKTKAPVEALTQEKILASSKEFFSYRIFFEFDSAHLTQGSKNSLKAIAEEIKKMKPAPEEIILNGYTDRAGNEEYNLALSKKRATSVKNYLASLGVEKDKIVIFAFGESDNAIDSSDGAREPGSRRVEISIAD